MTEEEKELTVKQIMINQQLLKAIIIMLSPTRSQGIEVIEECQENIEKAFNMISKNVRGEIQNEI